MSILRDIFRRKGRSILTISGISVGVFALVVLGSFSENNRVYVDKLTGYYEGVITVVEEKDSNVFGMSSGNRPLSPHQVDAIHSYPDVDEAYSMCSMLLNDEVQSIIPPMAMGTEGAMDGWGSFELSSGRGFGEDESGCAVIGSDMAKQLGAGLGDTIDVRGEPFEVVGMLERTYVNLIDSAVLVPLSDTQQMFYDSLPETFRATVEPGDLIQQVTVEVDPDVDADALARQMARDIEGISATGPTEMMKTVQGLVSLSDMFIGAIATIALLIGGFSIINTMTTAVTERTREIGVKRALGASRWRIAREVLAESALMGALGGLGGLIVGAIVSVALNSVMVAQTGTTALLMTGRLAAYAIVFSVVLGTLGGLYPARFAALLDPAKALAHE